METLPPSPNRVVARRVARPLGVAAGVARPRAVMLPYARPSPPFPSHRRRLLPAWGAFVAGVGAVTVYLVVSVAVGVGIMVVGDPGWQQVVMRAGLSVSQLLAFVAVPVAILLVLRLPLRVGLSIRGLNPGLVVLTLASLPALLAVAQAISIAAHAVIPDFFGGSELIGLLLAANGWGEFIVVLLVIAAVPAVAEECLFRGIFQTALSYRLRWLPAVTISSCCFMLVHLDPLQILSIAILSFYLGMIVIRTGSILYGTIIHLLNNAIAVALGIFAVEPPDMKIDYAAVGLVALLAGVGVVLAFRMWLRLTHPPVVPGVASAFSADGASTRPIGWQPIPVRTWQTEERLVVLVIFLVGLIGNYAIVRIQGAEIQIPTSAEAWSKLHDRLSPPPAEEPTAEPSNGAGDATSREAADAGQLRVSTIHSRETPPELPAATPRESRRGNIMFYNGLRD